MAGLTFQGDFSYGWVDTFQCDPGEPRGAGDEVGGTCDYSAPDDAQVTDLTYVIGKRKDAASTYSGTVRPVPVETDHEGPGGPPFRTCRLRRP